MTIAKHPMLHWRKLLQVALGIAFVAFVGFPPISQLLTETPEDYSQIFAYLGFLLFTTILVNAWIRYFQQVHNRSISDTRVRASFSLYVSVPLAYLLFVLLTSATLNFNYLNLSIFTALFAVAYHHLSSAYTQAKATVLHRVLIFGIGPQAEIVATTLQRSDPNVRVVGFYPSPIEEAKVVPQEMILSRERTLTETTQQMNVDEIVVALTERRGGSMPLRELLDCRLKGTRVFDLAGFFEENFGQIRLDSLYAGWLIFGDGFNQGAVRSAVKRAFDIVFALILLVLALPLMLLSALAIVIESGFPIIYSQERVGLHGRLFKVIKFRSMRTDAEKDGKAQWATKNDSRITRVGKILRKVRLDELPQLFCVLRGDMSLVGPRPERQVFVDQLTREIPFYAARHSVKPGVTGWAQVRYHYCSSVEDSAEKLQYDLYYVKHHTLFFDLVVLFDTVSVVLTGKGAH